MEHSIKYPYSKKNGFVIIGVMLILGLLFLSNVFKAFKSNDRIDLIVFVIFLVILVSVMGIVVFKRLIPALNNQIALELNEKGIVDYIRNITIDWRDIESINFKRNRSSSLLGLILKWESDYGSQIFISLRWIEGNDNDIYSTVLSYFDKFYKSGSITKGR